MIVLNQTLGEPSFPQLPNKYSYGQPQGRLYKWSIAYRCFDFNRSEKASYIINILAM